MSEAELLASIDAAPGDPGPLGVYADWLDERGDERGQLLRLERAAEALPVWHDEVWASKPRREALRAEADEPWLRSVGLADPRPVFAHGWPDGWRERWRLLRTLIERWSGHVLGDVGTGAAEGRGRGLELVQRAIRSVASPSLAELFRVVGCFDGEIGWLRVGDRLMLGRGRDQDGTPLLAISYEAEELSPLLIGVLDADLELDDPPVGGWEVQDTVNDDGQSDLRPVMVPMHRSVSGMVLASLLRPPIVHLAGDRQHSSLELYGGSATDALADELREQFPVAVEVEGRWLFERPGMLIRFGRGRSLGACAAPGLPPSALPTCLRGFEDKILRATGLFQQLR